MKALVLLHGWGMNASVFEALSALLVSRYRVYTPDLPGHGGRAACEPYTLETLAGDIAADAPESCCVAGWSLGALVALAWARARPTQVERLALLGATPCFSRRDDWTPAVAPAVMQTFAASLADDAQGTLVRFIALQAQGDSKAKHVRARLSASLTARPAPPVDVLQHGLHILDTADLRAALGAIAQPALVVHGERDQLVPLAAAEYLARALGRGKLRVVAAASHAPFVSDPDAVSALIAEHFS
jgi:pimeloyl-[acyl-carrier protein] methyl ester esterase